MTNPTPGSWLYSSRENDNPEADTATLDFLRTRLALVAPTAARRDLDNEFSEDGDELLGAALIEAAVDDTLWEMATSDADAFAMADLARKQDLASRVVVVRERARVPEAADHLVVASIRTWDPKTSPTGEVNFGEVRADLADLVDRFPQLQEIRYDEGAEAGTISGFLRQHPRLSTRVQPFTASPTANMDLWSALVARFNAGTLSIPRHQRLLAELRGLRREEFAYGARWRVVDSSRRYHRDVSVSLAGAVLAASAKPVNAIRRAESGNAVARRSPTPRKRGAGPGVGTRDNDDNEVTYGRPVQ